jgi:hypothetical protein
LLYIGIKMPRLLGAFLRILKNHFNQTIYKL